MDGELEQPPGCLTGTYVPRIHKTGDLVVRIRHCDRCTVRSLIDVLINILNRLDRRADLDINMRAVLLEEERVIRDNLAVIINDLLVRKTGFRSRKGLTRIPSPVDRVAIVANGRSVCKRLRKALYIL